ncbi:MAG TPA: hypothetical protein VGM80_03265 [Gaiellaceae bacterium]|jgi:hypothetical protein
MASDNPITDPERIARLEAMVSRIVDEILVPHLEGADFDEVLEGLVELREEIEHDRSVGSQHVVGLDGDDDDDGHDAAWDGI